MFGKIESQNKRQGSFHRYEKKLFVLPGEMKGSIKSAICLAWWNGMNHFLKECHSFNFVNFHSLLGWVVGGLYNGMKWKFDI